MHDSIREQAAREAAQRQLQESLYKETKATNAKLDQLIHLGQQQINLMNRIMEQLEYIESK